MFSKEFLVETDKTSAYWPILLLSFPVRRFFFIEIWYILLCSRLLNEPKTVNNFQRTVRIQKAYIIDLFLTVWLYSATSDKFLYRRISSSLTPINHFLGISFHKRMFIIISTTCPLNSIIQIKSIFRLIPIDLTGSKYQRNKSPK